MRSAKFRTATALAGGALTAIAIPAGNAQAATPPGPAGARLGTAGHTKAAVPDAACGGGVITWQDRYDNRYLEIYHSGKANGNWADAYPGNGTCTQDWFAVASGVSASRHALYGMVNTNSDKCLAAPQTNVGNAHVVQESCGYSHYTYRWGELSFSNGWVLWQGAVVACEDVSNHWIYTSTGNIIASTSHVDYTPKNCVWH